MIIHRCDRCGKIIEEEEESGLLQSLSSIIQSATQVLSEFVGAKPIPCLVIGKEGYTRKVDLCSDCQVSFKKWYRGEWPDELQEQNEQEELQPEEAEDPE